MCAEIYTNLNLLCRTCLQELSPDVLDTNKYEISQMPKVKQLLTILTVKACYELNDEQLPCYLCEQCYAKIQDFCSFQRKCIESFHKFQKMRKTAASATSKAKPQVGRPSRARRKVGHAAKKQTELLQANQQHATSDRAENNLLPSLSDEEAEPKLKNTKRPARKKRLANTNTNAEAINIATKPIFQCKDCPRWFHVEFRLAAHMRMKHQQVQPYICTVEGCKMEFWRANAIRDHLLVHEGGKFACQQPDCNKSYKQQSTLNLHMRNAHGNAQANKRFICEVCGKSFKIAALLKNHMYLHMDKSAYPFACEEPNCGKRFIKKEKLKEHTKRHLGIKNFSCPYCGMQKTTANELKTHINYHTLEKTYPCCFCTHVCNSAGNLKTHIRTVHERAKDYACQYCDKSFAKPDTRKYHEMTHTGEKPNACPECGKRFIQPAAMRTHRKIHYRNGPVPELPRTSSKQGTSIAIAILQEDAEQLEESLSINRKHC